MATPFISSSTISVYDGPDGPSGDNSTLVRNQYRKTYTEEGEPAIRHRHWDEPFSWPDNYEESVEVFRSEEERDAAYAFLKEVFTTEEN